MPRHAHDFEPADYRPLNLDRSAPIVPQLYAAIRQKILSMELLPGTEVSEAGLAAAAGVSRTPARQVIKDLVGDRLLEAFPSQGTYVSRIDGDRLREALMIRMQIEPAVARMRAEMTDRSELVRTLKGILDQHADALAKGDTRFAYECDKRFHQTICETHDDSFTWQVVRQARTEADRMHALTTDRSESLESALAHHRDIVDAIEQGDGPRAERCMRQHMQQNQAVYDSVSVSNTDFFVQRPSNTPDPKRSEETLAGQP